MSLFSKVFRLRQRQVRITVIGAATLMAMTSMVAAQESGLYGRLYGGLANVSGLSFTDPATANLDLNGGTGLTFGGAVGFAARNGFRGELDFTLSEADIDGQLLKTSKLSCPAGKFL